MIKHPMFHVKKRVLLAIAGCVWIIAGVNVVRLGILSYMDINHVLTLDAILSVLVLAIFSIMFYKMSLKHLKRISLYQEDTKPFWNFFDLKSYLIMIFMMSGGIWLRYSGLASTEFIAVFYTGLGLALIFAGIIFWNMFIKFK